MKHLSKSLFITAFPTWALLLALHSISNFSLQKLGILLSSMTVIVFFAGLYLKPRARTSAFLLPYTLLMGTGLAIALFYLDTYAVLLTSSLVVLWWAYLSWYSYLPAVKDSKLQLHQQLPKLEFETSDGKKISTDELPGDFKILMFYRGNWCPLCVAQIKEVAAHYRELQEMNTTVLLISPQPSQHHSNLHKKFNVPFYYVKDVKNRVARALGIAHLQGIPFGFQLLGYDSDTVFPTVIITNKKGNIIHIEQTDNYRVRPEPSAYISIIKYYN